MKSGAEGYIESEGSVAIFFGRIGVGEYVIKYSSSGWAKAKTTEFPTQMEYVQYENFYINPKGGATASMTPYEREDVETKGTSELRKLCRDAGWRGLTNAMATKEQCVEFLVTGKIPAGIKAEMEKPATATPKVVVAPPKPEYMAKMTEWWQLAEDVISSVVEQAKAGGDVIHRILLYGPPGTGKTFFAWSKLVELLGDESKVYMDTAQEDKPADSLLGSYIPEKSGSWVFTLGYGPNAFEHGALVVNEIDKASIPYMTECYKIGDDRKIALIRTPDGRVFKPNPKFMFIATMNGMPEDLPEALLDRFDIKIYIKSPHPEAINSLSPDLRELVVSAYGNPEKVDMTFREFRAFDRLRKILGDEKAGQGVFGKQWNDIKSAINLRKAEK